MSVAFSEGRGLHERDRVLMEAPPEIRNAFLLFSHMQVRNTRDRSFLVHELNDGKTEPFFYPLIPALASGLEALIPGYGRDGLMPLFGLLFCGCLLYTGWRLGGNTGVCTALVFCLGCPLPLWLFRGFYVEAAAGALFAMAFTLWHWRPRSPFWPCLAAGLSASVHPVFLVLGPPLAVLMTSAPRLSRRQGWLGLAGLGLGLLPLLMMTAWMAAPYGTLNLSHLWTNLKVSTPHQLVFAGLLFSLGLLGLSQFAVPLRLLLYQQLRKPCRRWLLTAAALLPLLLSVGIWPQRGLVQQGLMEGWLAIRWPMGLLMLWGIWVLHRPGTPVKTFALWGLFLISLPLFCYLKGSEQMGMWSQRRLFPAYCLLALSLLPVCAADLSRRGQGRTWAVSVRVAVLMILAFSNLFRWPDPYMVRVEKGAFAEMRMIRERLGERLVFFDYLPFSFPFAVDNRTRALGLNDQAIDQLDKIVDWLAARSLAEEVLVMSAYASPGLEQGMRLLPGERFAFMVDRISAKAALPAVKKVSEIDMQILEVQATNLQDPILAVDKILDGGPLALRPPWGNSRRSILQGRERLPADWSRQNSGVVGPLPLPGGEVWFRFWAGSGREQPQRLYIQPPWAAEPVEIEIPVAYQEVSLRFRHPSHAVDLPLTGVYRLSSPTPYDPALEGIRGFPDDLGALIHRIRIERVPVAE